MIKRKNVSFCETTSNRGYKSKTIKLNMPKLWLEKLGITPEEKSIIMELEDECIKIYKDEGSE